MGAPKANTSQPGIVEAGAVYYCPWPGPSHSCRQIPFDSTSEYQENFSSITVMALLLESMTKLLGCKTKRPRLWSERYHVNKLWNV